MSIPAYKLLVSKALDPHQNRLAMSASWNDNAVWARTLDYGSDLQYWELRPARNNTAFAIINKARRMCLARNGGGNGSGLMLLGLDQIPLNDKAVWRIGDGVTYANISSFADGAQNVNVPGDGPYTDGQGLITWEWSGGAVNELWSRVDEAIKVTMKSIDFDLRQGNIQEQEPLIALPQTVRNDTDEKQTQTVVFRFRESHSFSFRQERSLEISETFEFKTGVPEVAASRLAVQVKGKRTWTTADEQTEEKEVVLEVPVTVGPHSATQVSVWMLRAQLDVPYRVVLTYEFPDNKTVDRESTGLFSGVNGYNVMTKFETIGPNGRTVTEMPAEQAGRLTITKLA